MWFLYFLYVKKYAKQNNGLPEMLWFVMELKVQTQATSKKFKTDQYLNIP